MNFEVNESVSYNNCLINSGSRINSGKTRLTKKDHGLGNTKQTAMYSFHGTYSART